jgi:NADH dehydrogenase
VQVAGELAALAGDRDLDAEVVLLEQRDRVAPAFDERFAAAVASALGDAGVDVRTGTHVVGADADAVDLQGDGRLDYDQFVWTGGIRGPDTLGGERPQVRATMTLSGRTFVLGDAALVVDRDGEPVPATAQAAVAEAEAVAENVQRIVDQDPDAVFDPRLEQFDFRPRGWAVSVGDAVVAQVGSQVLTGQPATVVKATVGARHLAGVGAVEDALEVTYEELGLLE